MNRKIRQRLVGSAIAMCVLLMLATVGGGWGNVFGQTAGPTPTPRERDHGHSATPTAVPCKAEATPVPDVPAATPQTPCGAPPPSGPLCQRLGGPDGTSTRPNAPVPCQEGQPIPAGFRADAPAPNAGGARSTTNDTALGAGVVQTAPSAASSAGIIARIGGWWSALVNSIW